MSPADIMNHATNSRRTHAEAPCDRGLRFSGCESRSNVDDFGVRQFGISVTLSAIDGPMADDFPAFRDAVGNVDGLRGGEQVKWIAADRIIAGVANGAIGRDLASAEDIGPSMSAKGHPAPSQGPVAALENGSHPRPALVGSAAFDFAPEQIVLH